MHDVFMTSLSLFFQMNEVEMKSNSQQGRVFCITGVKVEQQPDIQHPIGQSTPARKLIGHPETDSSGYLSSSSFESSGEERRLKLNEQKVFQVWEKWGQQMQVPKFSTPKSPRTARRSHQRPFSLADTSEIVHPKSAIKIKNFSGDSKIKRVVIKSNSDELRDMKFHSVYKTLSDGDISESYRAPLTVRKDPIGKPADQRVPENSATRVRSNSSSSSRSCGSGRSDYSDYSSLPRQRGKYDGRQSDDECSLAKQVSKSNEDIYDNGVCVDESMSEFLANVNRENLESLLNFYDRVTANEVRRKQKNYEAVYY